MKNIGQSPPKALVERHGQNHAGGEDLPGYEEEARTGGEPDGESGQMNQALKGAQCGLRIARCGIIPVLAHGCWIADERKAAAFEDRPSPSRSSPRVLRRGSGKGRKETLLP